MSLNELLLILTWLVPLALGLLQLTRLNATLPLAGLAALPALLTALFVPLETTLEIPELLLGSVFALDATGQVFLLFTAILWLIAALFAQAYLKKDEKQPHFFAFFLLAMAGNFGLIVAADMFNFYLWFALMSFASYGLIVHSGQAEARQAGRLYMILVIVGEVALFSALVLINATAETARLAELSERSIDTLSAALIAASFGIKAGAVLLHLWLPLAHPAAPIPASAVLSGAMIKAGVLGWLRFLYPADSVVWGELFLIAGLATAFYGAVMGVSQTNAKTVLAYSSISQMGFIMVGVGAWLIGGELRDAALVAVGLYALHHALAKGALFLGVAFAGASKLVPLALLLPALALAGLPLTSGAVAKAALKSLTDKLAGGWAEALSLGLSLAAIGTTLLMARFLWLIWHAPKPHKAIPRLMWLTWTALLIGVASVIFILPEASAAVNESLKESKVAAAVPPILIGAALSAAVALVATVGAKRLPALKLPLVAPGDVLIVFAALYTALDRLLRAALEGIVALQERVVASLSGQRALNALSGIAGRLEWRLRTDWLVSGGALLLISLGVLLIVWLSGGT
jgi:formate hydrogenlyase subunit 3/multisubunit Na+/H+ antiporter MnhD subunit